MASHPFWADLGPSSRRFPLSNHRAEAQQSLLALTMRPFSTPDDAAWHQPYQPVSCLTQDLAETPNTEPQERTPTYTSCQLP